MRSILIPTGLTLGLLLTASAGAGEAPARQHLDKAKRDGAAAVGGAKGRGDAAEAERLRAELRETLRDGGLPGRPEGEVRLEPAELHAYAGRYLMRGGRLQVVARDGDRRTVSDSWTRRAVALIPLGDGRFRRADGAAVSTFLRDETGKVSECICRRPALDGLQLYLPFSGDAPHRG